eukprot:symbB.v1.2.033982.t1/scaffold4295.1/size41780/1
MKARGEDENLLRWYFESTVQMTVQGFRDVGATEQGIRREVQSMMLDPMTDWNSSSLPVWMISDLHYDHKANAEWCQALDDAIFQEDVLIVAGNVAETFRNVLRALEVLKEKFRRVFYVPGNKDLALNASEVRTSRFPDSVAKLLALLKACEDIGVDVFPASIGQDVYVVPLFSWYTADFDKRSRPDPNLGFDAQCVWPLDQQQLWKWMLKLNEAHLRLPYRGTVLTFSHFLPLTNLPFDASGYGL